MLQHLMEDNKVGKLRKELESSGYKECFQELSIQEGVIMRGEIMVIPKTLRPDVLQESMTRQLRLSWWWPKYTTDIREFNESCIPCRIAGRL